MLHVYIISLPLRPACRTHYFLQGHLTPLPPPLSPAQKVSHNRINSLSVLKLRSIKKKKKRSTELDDQNSDIPRPSKRKILHRRFLVEFFSRR